MIEERLNKLEEQIEASENLPKETREEMLHLLAALRAEIADLPEETQLAIPDGEGSALAELNEKVKELESSHPDLAAAVNRLSIVLSNMGM
ncbi:MAG: DUF4404 family protein [Chthoniobacteraceae bacterium]